MSSPDAALISPTSQTSLYIPDSEDSQDSQPTSPTAYEALSRPQTSLTPLTTASALTTLELESLPQSAPRHGLSIDTTTGPITPTDTPRTPPPDAAPLSGLFIDKTYGPYHDCLLSQEKKKERDKTYLRINSKILQFTNPYLANTPPIVTAYQTPADARGTLDLPPSRVLSEKEIDVAYSRMKAALWDGIDKRKNAYGLLLGGREIERVERLSEACRVLIDEVRKERREVLDGARSREKEGAGEGMESRRTMGGKRKAMDKADGDKGARRVKRGKSEGRSSYDMES